MHPLTQWTANMWFVCVDFHSCSSSSPGEPIPASARPSWEDWSLREPWDPPSRSARWSNTAAARRQELLWWSELSQMTWELWKSPSWTLPLSASRRLPAPESPRPADRASLLMSSSWNRPQVRTQTPICRLFSVVFCFFSISNMSLNVIIMNRHQHAPS